MFIKNDDNKLVDNHTSRCDIMGDNDHHYHTDELPDNSVVESTNDSNVECVVGTPHSDNMLSELLHLLSV